MFSVEKPLRNDPDKKLVFVGDHCIDKPDFTKRTEMFWHFKAYFAGWPEGGEGAHAKVLNKHFADILGPKFCARFYAAQYHTWIGPHFTRDVANMLTYRGRHFSKYNSELVIRAHEVKQYIDEAVKDGLLNLVPVIVVFKKSPQEIRAEVGKAAWRRLHHISKARATNMMKYWVEGHMHTSDFVSLLDVPASAIPFASPYDGCSLEAARKAKPITSENVLEATVLIRDTRRMIGGAYNSEWSLSRIKREHDAAARALASKQYPESIFADSWSFEEGGFKATRLVLQADIATEGYKQHHCVASYAGMAASGTYFVFEISGIERATLGARIDGKGVKLDQVYGAYNQTVTPECMAFARRVLKEFSR